MAHRGSPLWSPRSAGAWRAAIDHLVRIVQWVDRKHALQSLSQHDVVVEHGGVGVRSEEAQPEVAHVVLLERLKALQEGGVLERALVALVMLSPQQHTAHGQQDDDADENRLGRVGAGEGEVARRGVGGQGLGQSRGRSMEEPGQKDRTSGLAMAGTLRNRRPCVQAVLHGFLHQGWGRRTNQGELTTRSPRCPPPPKI